MNSKNTTMQDKSELLKHFQLNDCTPKNIFGNKTWKSTIFEYFFTPDSNKQEFDKSKYELKPFEEFQTYPTDSNGHSKSARNQNNQTEELFCEKKLPTSTGEL